MKAYGMPKKSKTNFHDADTCEVPQSNNKNRKVVKKKTRQESKKISRLTNFEIIDGYPTNLNEIGLEDYF